MTQSPQKSKIRNMFYGIDYEGTQDLYELEKEIAPKVTKTSSPWQNNLAALELPPSTGNYSLLDIGGGASSLVPRLLGRGVDAYSVDPAYSDLNHLKASVEESHRHFRQNGEWEALKLRRSALEAFLVSYRRHPDRYITGFATSLPFTDERFDVVCSIATISQFLDWREDLLTLAIQESLRVAKPGGTVQYFPFKDEEALGPEIDEKRMKLQDELVEWLQSNPNVAGIRYKVLPAHFQYQMQTLIIDKKPA